MEATLKGPSENTNPPFFTIISLVLVVFLIASKKPASLANHELFTARLRRGADRFHITAEPKLYESLGTGELIRVQSRQRFWRSRELIERRG